ncbi:oxidoreductase [Granulicella sibirica]|uniref:Aldo-keto reductase n=1 Tax=Granulicella sibirica TaxID=2479048 RepID=A0A4Q0TAD0_9BACT|nr:oxidoreductase [Granulicella sibirica]RXH58949.1 Aldo-keto reductase [Granulicella sibirica]
MTNQADLGGMFTFPGTQLQVRRMGFGAMQLAGPHAYGPSKARDGGSAVLNEVIAAGVNHIDTSDYYGPHSVNQIIRQTLHPYRDDLVIVTKLGWRRGDSGSWIPAVSASDITAGAHENLRNLGLDALEIVNLRVGGELWPTEGSIEEPMTALAELQRQGLIRHLGVSNVSPQQYAEAKKIAQIVCVQNFYNVAQRRDDAFIDQLDKEGVAYVPYFPLGGMTPLQSAELDVAAASVNATSLQVALHWLLKRSPNILLIPGTSSLLHLKENLEAVDLELSAEMLTQLNAMGSYAA